MIVSVTDIRKTYSKGALPVPVLHGVSFSVEEGEFVSIVGRSGSGKSTLLNLIGGLDTPTGGSIVVAGTELTRASRRGLALHRRHTVGMVFQSWNLLSSRTALENVTLALAFGGVKRRDRERAAADLLGSLGLARRLSHRPGELSGGESQRVAIARALANRPRVLLADEPTGNLDSVTADEIVGLLRGLNRERGLTVLMVTHDESTAAAVSGRVLRMRDGRILDAAAGRGGAA